MYKGKEEETMKNILLVCSAGMSTSMLVTKMQESAKEKGIDVMIKAIPQIELNLNLSNADIILLGPQVRFILDQVKASAGKIPVEVIDMTLYGTMNGEKVLMSALEMIGDGK